jgi:hypothetical protein
MNGTVSQKYNLQYSTAQIFKEYFAVDNIYFFYYTGGIIHYRRKGYNVPTATMGMYITMTTVHQKTVIPVENYKLNAVRS